MNTIVPIPSANVTVRGATAADVAFIDQLQKRHQRQVGFMRTSWIENKIKSGQVIVATDAAGAPVGYCMGVDRYFKRDDVGIIYQMNVAAGNQRKFVGATLLKAMFERSAYGCKLYCCWCAQDIEANRFWESMGFVPLAYRAGSAKKGRVHIFWQKRIREGDRETPWWFPSQTNAGAMNEDRLVLPIPPGKHWSDELPVFLPALSAVEGPKSAETAKRLPPPRKKEQRPKLARVVIGRSMPNAPQATKPVESKKPKMPKAKRKNDPKMVAAARELRDRWLEHVNSGMAMLEGSAKYDVVRVLPERISPTPLLPAAA